MACGMCSGYRRCKAMKLTAIFEPQPEGGYTWFVEEVPAAIKGETLEEAKANLVDALDLVLATQSIS